MDLFTPDDPGPIHFLGIGGAGMSALALIALRRGLAVTGCDADPRGAADVARAGAEIFSEHDPSHVSGVRALVYTAAVPSEHFEITAARSAGIPVFRRAEALGAAVEGGTLVAVAGTHGKTTTTVMVTEMLTAAGRNPTGIAGGRVADWGGNARFGGNEMFVVEADEYDRSFLALRPDVAVINNVEADHLECYGSLTALEQAFAEFAGRAERAIIGADDGGAMRVARSVGVPTWTVGLAADAHLRLSHITEDRHRSRARVDLPAGGSVEIELHLPGLHNLRNAAMALGAVVAVDANVDAATRALSELSGIDRRFEIVGTAGGITIIDDYAHHPSEVEAAISGTRQHYPDSRVIVVFQPHLYTRTQLQAEAFGKALAAAELVLVTEVYAAREDPIPGVSGELVVEAARKYGGEVEWVGELSSVSDVLEQVIRGGDLVLFLGAGDITEVSHQLFERLGGPGA